MLKTADCVITTSEAVAEAVAEATAEFHARIRAIVAEATANGVPTELKGEFCPLCLDVANTETCVSIRTLLGRMNVEASEPPSE